MESPCAAERFAIESLRWQHGAEAFHGSCPTTHKGDDKWIAQTWLHWFRRRDAQGFGVPPTVGEASANQFFYELLAANESLWSLPHTGEDAAQRV
jgi:hypothetical protein